MEWNCAGEKEYLGCAALTLRRAMTALHIKDVIRGPDTAIPATAACRSLLDAYSVRQTTTDANDIRSFPSLWNSGDGGLCGLLSLRGLEAEVLRWRA